MMATFVPETPASALFRSSRARRRTEYNTLPFCITVCTQSICMNSSSANGSHTQLLRYLLRRLPSRLANSPEMPLPPGLFSIYARFLSRSTPKDSLDRLPNDVIVDFIFDYLDVIDIIRMRMVRPSFESGLAETGVHGWNEI